MADIEGFSLIRQDGRTLTEGMGLADLERLGWPACPIVAVHWTHAGRAVILDVKPGSLAQVVDGRRYVALLSEQAGHPASRLLVMGPDGSVSREISNNQMINGRTENVEFAWFEKPQRATDGTFGVVVNLQRGVTYQLDVDAASGAVLSAKETR